MKANERQLLRYLEGSDKNFIIPVYQRNYDWQEKQCSQLFDDLISIVKNNYRTHFLGSLVSIYSDNGDQEYLVIDGQQRLTTLTLLLLALHNYIVTNNIETRFAIPQKIKEEYLINKYAENERKIRLKPIKNDNEAFVKLFSGDDLIEESNITKNYNYYYNRISRQEINCDELFNAITKLIIVDIELKRGEDDPQLIFESLNSTGLNLSQADLVRNFILMGESVENQEKFYIDYWNRIEINTAYKSDDFIRDYLTYKTNLIPKKSNVYIAFKNFVESNILSNKNFTTKSCLEELLKFSKYYKLIIEQDCDNSLTKELLYEISRLDITVSYPFILELLDDVSTGIINTEELNQILHIIISYIFRRTICDVPTHGLNKFFMVLGRELKKFPEYKNNYVEILKYLLVNKKGTQRYPNDEEFISKLKVKDLYNMQAKSKYHFFKLIETYDNNEKADVDLLLDNKKLSIEHIMPQTLTPNWKNELGEDAEIIHSKYLHTIGNLTLTGYNSKYSNSSFMNKKTMEKGFNESTLFLNSYLKNLTVWNKNTIKGRADYLTQRAIKIWTYPKCHFTPMNVATENIFNLSDDYDFTGEKIYQFEVLGTIYKVDCWRDFEEQMLKLLFELDSNLLFEFANLNYKKKLSCISSNLRTPLKITEKIYAECNLSTKDIVNLILSLIEKFGLDGEDISLYIR